MAARFMILIPLIVLVPDIYIWFVNLVWRGSKWKYLHWVPTLLAVGLVTGVVMTDRDAVFMYALLTLLIGLYVPKIVYTLVSLPFRIAAVFRKGMARVGDCIGGTLAVAAMACMIYGLTYGWRQITVKEVTITSDRLPEAFDGYRIAQISDLHLGTFDYARSFVRNVVVAVNRQRADMVCFTGDIVNFRSNELHRFTKVLSKIKAPDGVYSIMGNHDYCEYYDFESPDGALHNAELVIQMEKAMGWHLLQNEHRFIRRGNDSIALIGVENCGEPPFRSYSNLPQAISGVDDDSYQILLSHNPVHWRKEVLGESRVDLMLAGHTHAMQFRIGRFSPSAWRYREWGGLYKEGSRSLYVNTGTGGNFLFRFGAWPEITVITLRVSR
jgi:predicted MPP superfamily phosphohydrolase